MDNLLRNTKQWSNSRLSAPWQGATLAPPNRADTTADQAETEDELTNTASRLSNSAQEILGQNPPGITAAMESAITRTSKTENQALQDQIQDLQTKLARSQKYGSRAEAMVNTMRREQEGLQAKHMLLKKEHDKNKTALTDLQTENCELHDDLHKANESVQKLRTALKTETDGKKQALWDQKQRLQNSFSDDKKRALQDQKQYLTDTLSAEKQEAVQKCEEKYKAISDKLEVQQLTEQKQRLTAELQMTDSKLEAKQSNLNAQYRCSVSNSQQEGSPTTMGEQLPRDLQDMEWHVNEQEPVAETYTLATNPEAAHLSEVAVCLESGAKLFGITFPGSCSLSQRASRLAKEGMMRVSQSYRVPIEQLCSKIGVTIDAWPAIGHVDHYAQLEVVLKEALGGVELQYRAKQVLLYNSLELSDRTDAVIAMQAERVQALTTELRLQRAQGNELAKALKEWMEIAQGQ